MTQLTKYSKNDEQTQASNEIALKVLELTKYMKSIKAKRKSICAAFTEEFKRAEKERDDILNGEPTSLEVIKNINEPHDLEFV